MECDFGVRLFLSRWRLLGPLCGMPLSGGGGLTLARPACLHRKEDVALMQQQTGSGCCSFLDLAGDAFFLGRLLRGIVISRPAQTRRLVTEDCFNVDLARSYEQSYEPRWTDLRIIDCSSRTSSGRCCCPGPTLQLSSLGSGQGRELRPGWRIRTCARMSPTDQVPIANFRPLALHKPIAPWALPGFALRCFACLPWIRNIITTVRRTTNP